MTHTERSIAAANGFQVWHDGEPLPESLRGAITAIGNFDGVHRGHQRLIAVAREAASRLGRPSTVLTFEPHARSYFRPELEEGGSDAAFSGYRNEEIIRISKAAEGEQDTAKRTAAYREVQRIAMSEVPQLYLFHPSVVYATRDNVRGFAIFPTRLYRLWETWKTQ